MMDFLSKESDVKTIYLTRADAERLFDPDWIFPKRFDAYDKQGVMGLDNYQISVTIKLLEQEPLDPITLADLAEEAASNASSPDARELAESLHAGAADGR
jgi:hypothetical protein